MCSVMQLGEASQLRGGLQDAPFPLTSLLWQVWQVEAFLLTAKMCSTTRHTLRKTKASYWSQQFSQKRISHFDTIIQAVVCDYEALQGVWRQKS